MNKKIKSYIQKRRSDFVMIVVFILLCIGLFWVNLLPNETFNNNQKVKAEVISIDNSTIQRQGLLVNGFQKVKLKILSSKYQDKIFIAYNQLRSQMELDKIFSKGDIVIATMPNKANPQKDIINAQDHYRIDYIFVLCICFAFLLIFFGGIIGFKSLLSFFVTCLVIWKLAIPLCLLGFNPILVSFCVVLLLTAVIIFLVAGLNRKGVSAFAGSIVGVAISCIMAIIFTNLFKLNGATMPYSQALYYSGYEFLDLTAIYIGAIFLSSSGAVMDLAMDVVAGMAEVVKAKPTISRLQLIISGFDIGRNVVGTMTTTLLLAYSGGYLTLMMTFIAQGITLIDFINNPYVASEIVKTIIGSFGLVLVAPFSALMGGLFLYSNSPISQKK